MKELLNRILNTVLATQLVDYDVRKVLPSEYRLFQVADLICTLELLKTKMEDEAPYRLLCNEYPIAE